MTCGQVASVEKACIRFLCGEASALGIASSEVVGGAWGWFWTQMRELGRSKPNSMESAQTWGGGAFPVVMGSSSETPVWPVHCLLLFLQRQLCVLDYVWPAVDAFLRAGWGGDLITVLPNCRS